MTSTPYQVWFVRPDVQAAEFIADQYSMAVLKGTIPLPPGGALRGLNAQRNVGIFEAGQLLVPCPNNLQFDTSKLRNGDIIVGGYQSNPIACALKNLFPQVNWAINPGNSRTVVLTLPGSKVIRVVYGFDERDTRYQTMLLLQGLTQKNGGSFPTQTTTDARTPNDFEDIFGLEMFMGSNEVVSDSAFTGILEGELASAQNQLLTNFQLSLPPGGFDALPVGVVGRVGKVASPIMKTGLMKKGLEVFGKTGVKAFLVKSWGYIRKGASSLKKAATIFMRDKFIRRVAVGSLGIGAVGLGAKTLSSAVQTVRRNPELIPLQDNLDEMKKNCDAICSAKGAQSVDCITCRNEYNQQLKIANEAFTDAAKSVEPLTDTIKKLAIWGGIIVFGSIGTYYLIKSGTVAAAASRAREKVQNRKNGKKK